MGRGAGRQPQGRGVIGGLLEALRAKAAIRSQSPREIAALAAAANPAEAGLSPANAGADSKQDAAKIINDNRR